MNINDYACLFIDGLFNSWMRFVTASHRNIYFFINKTLYIYTFIKFMILQYNWYYDFKNTKQWWLYFLTFY